MYPVRILGVAPYPGLERIMQQLAAQRPEIQLITRIGSLRNWQDALSSVPASSYDVIISRGGTARIHIFSRYESGTWSITTVCHLFLYLPDFIQPT